MTTPDVTAAGPPSLVDVWHGDVRRVWPALGVQAVVTEMTYGKGRVCVGPVGGYFYDQGY